MKNSYKSQGSAVKQQGFTLIELVVVVAIIGALIALVSPNVAGSRDSVTANLLLRASQNIASNWNILSQNCGTTTDVTTSPIPSTAGASNVLSLLFGGTSTTTNGIATNGDYSACYNQSKILPLSEIGQYNSGWKVASYAVELSGGGSAPLSVTFKKVPDSIVSLIATKFNPSATVTTSAGSVAGMVTWTTPTSGARDVTIIRQIN